MKEIILRNGINVPLIGIGTWQITDRDTVMNVINDAYELGYRLVDTAAAYSNEISIAKAIENAGIPRGQIIISDKVWNSSRGYEGVQDACKRSLKKMKTDYFDMYLVHWPASKKLYPDWAEINADTWRGMERLYSEGLVKAIGVCNYNISHLEELRKTAEIMPFVDQVEFHPGYIQSELFDYCKRNNICLEASSPLGNGQILNNKEIIKIAEKHTKTPAQVCLNWAIKKEIIVIPKSTSRKRIEENINVFNFELDLDEEKILDEMAYCGGIGLNPDEVTEFG